MASENPPDERPEIEGGQPKWVVAGELQGVEAPCARCERQIGICVPHSLVTHGIGRGKRFTQLDATIEVWSGYGDPSLCLSCRLAAAPTEDAEWLRDEYRQLLTAAAESGVPDGAPVWPIYFSADDTGPHKGWHGFRGRLLAIQVVGLPPRLADWPNLNSWRFARHDGGPPIGLVVFQTAIWHERLAASLIFRSNPLQGQQTLEVRNWQRVTRQADLRQLMRGIEIYKVYETMGGRPPGGPFKDSAEFAASLKATIDGLQEQRKKVTLEAVAEYFPTVDTRGICDSRQLSRWLSTYLQCSWTVVRGWTDADWGRVVEREQPPG